MFPLSTWGNAMNSIWWYVFQMCGWSLWWLILHISLLFSDSTYEKIRCRWCFPIFCCHFYLKWWDNFNSTNIFLKGVVQPPTSPLSKNSSNNNSSQKIHDAQVGVLSLRLGRDNNWPFLIFTILRLCRTFFFCVTSGRQTSDLSLTWKFVNLKLCEPKSAHPHRRAQSLQQTASTYVTRAP